LVPIIAMAIWYGGMATSRSAFKEPESTGQEKPEITPYSGHQTTIRHDYSGGDPRKDADGEWKLSHREWVDSIDNPSIPDEGRWARFDYADADGVITQREIRNWSKRGAYIEGFCMLRRASRNFRQDRIIEWISG